MSGIKIALVYLLGAVTASGWWACGIRGTGFGETALDLRAWYALPTWLLTVGAIGIAIAYVVEHWSEK